MTPMSPLIGQTLEDFQCRLLQESDQTVSARELCGTRGAVVEFWTTSCPRCPAALEELNVFADELTVQRSGYALISVCLGNFEEGLVQVQEGKWDNVTHAHVEEEVGAALREKLGFGQQEDLPVLLVLSDKATILQAGDAHTARAAVKELFVQGTGTEQEGQQQQHQQQGTDTPASPAPESVPPSKSDGQCVGGVCPLPRRRKKGGASAPAPTAPTPAAAPVDKENSAPPKAMQCEGGVCKLVRKPKQKRPLAVQGQPQSQAPPAPPTAPAAVVEPLAVGSALPPFSLVSVADGSPLSTSGLAPSRTLLLDLWTTRCTRCPAALDKLQRLAADFTEESLTIASVCLDSLDGCRELLAKEPARWSKLQHLFSEPDEKERLCATFGVTAVPFYIVVDAEGSVRAHGSPKQVDLQILDTLAARKEQQQVKVAPAPPKVPKAVERAPSFSFTLDEDF